MSVRISRRQLAITDLVARLGFIQKAKDYATDAGLNIFHGESPKLGPDDVTSALAIFVRDDAPLQGAATQGGITRVKVPIEIHGIVTQEEGQTPGEAYEGLICDIKQAVEIEGNGPNENQVGNAATDRYLGVIEGTPNQPATLPKGLERGATRVNYREDGTAILGCVVEYFASFEEPWGQP